MTNRAGVGARVAAIRKTRGWYHGDSRRALGALIRARRVAPQQVRVHPMVRDAVRAIAHAEPGQAKHSARSPPGLGIDS
jgi:hypothetical protein